MSVRDLLCSVCGQGHELPHKKWCARVAAALAEPLRGYAECVRCGSPFPLPLRGSAPRYCGDDCRIETRRENDRARYWAKREEVAA